MIDDEPREPIPLPPSGPATCEKQYKITYRDGVGELFYVMADEISQGAITRQLLDAGFDVAVQKREVRTSAWERIGEEAA